jgi:hypothetical protein
MIEKLKMGFALITLLLVMGNLAPQADAVARVKQTLVAIKHQ